MKRFTVYCAHGCGQPVEYHDYEDDKVPADIERRLARWNTESYVTGHEPPSLKNTDVLTPVQKARILLFRQKVQADGGFTIRDHLDDLIDIILRRG